jgi:hypothetical protein
MRAYDSDGAAVTPEPRERRGAPEPDAAPNPRPRPRPGALIATVVIIVAAIALIVTSEGANAHGFAGDTGVSSPRSVVPSTQPSSSVASTSSTLPRASRLAYLLAMSTCPLPASERLGRRSDVVAYCRRASAFLHTWYPRLHCRVPRSFRLFVLSSRIARRQGPAGAITLVRLIGQTGIDVARKHIAALGMLVPPVPRPFAALRLMQAAEITRSRGVATLGSGDPPELSVDDIPLTGSDLT